MLSTEEREFLTKFKKRLADEIYEEAKGVVQAGPFKGMKLLNEEAWVVPAMAPVMLGIYEQELQPIIETEIARLENLDKPIVVNIGCAEGYYAVGLARRLPQATVYAIDSDENCLSVMKRNADLNSITNIVTGEDLNSVLDHPNFIVSDCEGAEVVYFDPVLYRGTIGATILYEIHDVRNMETDKQIWSHEIVNERYKVSHRINLVLESGRNPYNYELIRQKCSEERFMSMSEGRPYLMGWCYMCPRGWAVS